MLQLGIRGLGIARFKFNPLSWFSKGEPGAWYDPSDLTTLFQDSVGTIPVTAVGTGADQPVGLMLDKSKGLALGAELVTNGDFSNGSTGWATDPSWTIASGAATFAYTTALRLIKDFTGVTGKYCIVSVNILSTNASGGLYFYVGGIGYFVDTSTVGIKTFMVVWGGTRLTIQPQNTTWAGSITNISVKQIAGNHAFKATAANRPVLSARVNLLTKTEDFSDAVWWVLGSVAKTNNYTSAPDGTLTAGRIVFASNSSTHQFFQYQATTAISYTQKIWLKVPSGTGSIMFGFYDGEIKTSSIPLTTQWQQFSFSTTTVVNVSSRSIWLYPDGSAGMATEIHIWHPDLRPTNAGALLPPYQRVNTASDYDTVGFPLYLKANGTSSAMSTNSIDFSGTDKMTVVTGVRKLSDATGGILMELSGDYNTNSGTFGYVAPRSSALNEPVYVTRGTSLLLVSNSSNVAPSPINWVLSGQSSISTPIASSRINGATYASSLASQGSGNFGNYPLYLFSRTGLCWFNGQFYGAIIRGAQSDTASVTQTENYMAQKTGITF